MILKDKVAVVTGSGQGIGEGIAMLLAEEGARVVSTDINEKLAIKTSNEIIQQGGVSAGFKLDVTDSVEIQKVIEEALKLYSRIDIWVNNAGFNHPLPVLETSEELWDKIIDINLKSVFLCSKAAAGVMVKQKSGRIINISSVAGKIGAPFIGPYCAAKRGVIGLTEVLAIELGKYGICVNTICPGNTKTEMFMKGMKLRAESKGETLETLIERLAKSTALGRLGLPEDIGKAVVFLSSSYSDFVTGQAITVCGGRSINLS